MATNNVINVPLSGATGTGAFVGSVAPVISNVTVDNLNLLGNTLSSIDSNGPINIQPNNYGLFLIGSSTPVIPQANNITRTIISNNNAISLLELDTFFNNSTGSELLLKKSRSISIGTFTPVLSGDILGDIVYYGDDSTIFTLCGRIRCSVSGTVSVGIVPTSLSFYTSNSSGVVVSGLTIDQNQNVTLNNSAATLSVGNLSLTGNTLASTDTNGNINFQNNGNAILTLTPTTSAVNSFTIFNTATGIAPQIRAVGTDTDIDFTIAPKGAGVCGVNSTSITGLKLTTGTALQHQTLFQFADTANARIVTFPDITGTVQFQGQPISGTNLVTAPAASQTSSLIVGTAIQNLLGYDVVLTVYLAVASATTASILLGVGPTSTPTQQTIVNGLTLLALSVIPVTIYLPNNYYALLSTTGTISVSISGQQIMPV